MAINSYRNPLFLTKIISILDVLCQGRSKLGIGAWWYGLEYDATYLIFHLMLQGSTNWIKH
jgi:alkanesulfonate monooxygenase SsuD/methylene tetrahydromethanopterin reductase-like flavin-dependent oxidoreductase (luciferase family)